MIYTVKINNKEYEVEVERGHANIVKTTEVQSTTEVLAAPAPASTSQASPVAPASPLRQTPQVAQVAPATPVASATGELVKAPMPGAIIDVKVNQGSSVKKGDILLILEAMKMENEVVSPVDGVVTQVYVNKGFSVATNDALVSIN